MRDEKGKVIASYSEREKNLNVGIELLELVFKKAPSQYEEGVEWFVLSPYEDIVVSYTHIWEHGYFEYIDNEYSTGAESREDILEHFKEYDFEINDFQINEVNFYDCYGYPMTEEDLKKYIAFYSQEYDIEEDDLPKPVLKFIAMTHKEDDLLEF